MPDEEPLAPQPDVAPAQPDVAPPPLDAEGLTVELLRRPEVGDEHAIEPAPAPEAEPAGPEAAPEGPAAAGPAPVLSDRGPKLPPARARLVGVGIAGIAMLALVAGTVLVIRPGAAATSLPIASASARLAADAGGSVAPSIDEPTATAQPSMPEDSPTPEPTEIVLSPDAGRIVFGDDFVDARGGWPTGTTALTTTSLGKGFYAITGKGSGTDHLVEAPFQPRISQIAVTALATEGSGRGTAGFGVSCGAITAATLGAAGGLTGSRIG